MTKPDYGVNQIDVHEGPEGIRQNLSMYIGEDDYRGVVHLWKEVIGNSVDEATNGHGRRIRSHFAKDGTVTVADEGRGIPVGPRPGDRLGRDTLTILCTVTHSSGKFASAAENYGKGRIGTHGVGLAVVNALSETLEVWSYRDASWNYQKFARGEPVAPKPVRVKALPADLAIKNQPNAGTVVRYKPILSCFARGAAFNVRYALEWLDEISWLVGDVQLITQTGTQPPQTIHRPNGLRDRFDYEVARLGVESQHEPFVYHNDQLDVMIGWTSGTTETIFSAVGSVKTAEGGTHVSGLCRAITETFAQYAGKAEYKSDYLRVGMIAVVNVRFGETKPRFNSQDKVKLVSDEGREMVLDGLYNLDPYPLWTWLGERANRPLRDHVLGKAVEWTTFNAEVKASKELRAAYKTTSKGKSNLPKNLSPARTDDPNRRELFLVEGDSAAGTAKQANNLDYQEVLPLRGKLANLYKRGNVEEAMLEKSVVDIGLALGWEPDNRGNYRVGKAIILADADDDGFHIGALILALFWRQMSDFVRAGRLFMCDSPLYQYSTPTGKIYGATLAEVHANFQAAGLRASFRASEVTRMKGLGEANADVLGDVAFNPATRKLRQVLPLEAEAQTAKVVEWMGPDASQRAARLLSGRR